MTNNMSWGIHSSKVLDYLKQRDLYFVNAEEYVRKGLLRKSSEMLWGAVTQTIKALAAIFGTRIFAHIQFKEYMDDVAYSKRDRYYITELIKLERLHKNFYDEELSPREFALLFEDALTYIQKLNDIIAEHAQP